MIFWIIIIIAGLVLLRILLAYLKRPACPACKSKKVQLVSGEIIGREPVYFKEKQYIKEYKNTSGQRQVFDWETKWETNKYLKAPEKIMEKEVLVEGERIYYDATYKCAKCKNSFHRKVYTDKKPKIINQ